MSKKFLKLVKEKVAIDAVGISALRGERKAGLVKIARDHCVKLNLEKITLARDETTFRTYLNRSTNKLANSLSWGAARKALNLFLRDVLYNTYLSKAYKMKTIEPFLEMPLDNPVSALMRNMAGSGVLPMFPGIKWVTLDIWAEYQAFAKKEAKRLGISRVHLDLYLWLKVRKKSSRVKS